MDVERLAFKDPRLCILMHFELSTWVFPFGAILATRHKELARQALICSTPAYGIPRLNLARYCMRNGSGSKPMPQVISQNPYRVGFD